MTRPPIEFGHGAYAPINGLALYHEDHGSGRPLILLHGGMMSGEMFAPILASLMVEHRVILVDLQGHGRTADIDRPIRTQLMADDIAALITHLGLEGPDVAGFSLGAGVAIQVGIRHPEAVRRLVACSAVARRGAIYPEILEMQSHVNSAAAESMRDTEMGRLYQRVAPRPQDLGRLMDKLGALLAEDFDLTEQIRGLQVPTLIVAPDADMAPPRHFAEVFELLGGGRRDGGWMGEGRPAGGHALAILPGLTHYAVGASPLFAAVMLAFLDA